MNTKLQRNSKPHALKMARRVVLEFELGASLELGTWRLEFLHPHELA
ncbi:MAG: hypothetical protein KGJ60_15405 [Verrucomicrobiota bacterium]|nr:hypothetical protein [Verrucomicrobiota bacterium]